jgi:RHS repeat-associated protein
MLIQVFFSPLMKGHPRHGRISAKFFYRNITIDKLLKTFHRVTNKYLYDAFGRRIEKNVSSVAAPSDPSQTFSRRYVYDGQDVLLEYDGSNDMIARYTYSGSSDDVLAVNVTNAGVTAKLAQNSQSYFYLKDQLGSVVDIADSNGTKIQHYVYSIYGEKLATQDGSGNDISANPVLNTTYTFAGRELDPESGYYYNRARYYDPGTGRFLQKDPSPGKLGVPVSVVNSYVYASNNPLNLVDPTGKSIFGDILGAIVLVAIVAAAVFAPEVLLAAGALALQGALTGAAIGAGLYTLESAAGGFKNFSIGGLLSAAGTSALSGAVTGFVGGLGVGLSGLQLSGGLAAQAVGAGSAIVGSTAISEFDGQGFSWKNVASAFLGGAASGAGYDSTLDYLMSNPFQTPNLPYDGETA